MTQLATPSRRPLYLGKAKTGIRIQKPEIQSLWQTAPKAEPVPMIWKVLVGFTYIFSLMGLFFAFTA